MTDYIISNIREIFSIITGCDNVDELSDILEKSNIYHEITNNNEAYLYDGVNANVLDIANELIEKNIHPDIIKKITPDAIRIVNRTRKEDAHKTLRKLSEHNPTISKKANKRINKSAAYVKYRNNQKKAKEIARKRLGLACATPKRKYESNKLSNDKIIS